MKMAGTISGWSLLVIIEVSLAVGILALIALPLKIEEPIDGAGRGEAALDLEAARAAIDNYKAVSFKEARRRPLFSESRRPGPLIQPAQVPAKDQERPEVHLLGITQISAEVAFAYLAVGADAETVRVSKGDDLDGWLVTQIESHQVVLEQGAERITLTIGTKGSAGLKQQKASVKAREAGARPRTRRGSKTKQ